MGSPTDKLWNAEKRREIITICMYADAIVVIAGMVVVVADLTGCYTSRERDKVVFFIACSSEHLAGHRESTSRSGILAPVCTESACLTTDAAHGVRVMQWFQCRSPVCSEGRIAFKILIFGMVKVTSPEGHSVDFWHYRPLIVPSIQKIIYQISNGAWKFRHAERKVQGA